VRLAYRNDRPGGLSHIHDASPIVAQSRFQFCLSDSLNFNYEGVVVGLGKQGRASLRDVGSPPRFAVAFEKAESNWAAYVPDLPGCITTGSTLQETKHNIREAIELHLDAMLEAGEPIPVPSSEVDFVELETVA
jgi:predicted RNase H-like HicB family nuclease